MVRRDARIAPDVIERDLNRTIPSISCAVVEDPRDDLVRENVLDYESDERELVVEFRKGPISAVSEIRIDAERRREIGARIVIPCVARIRDG